MSKFIASRVFFVVALTAAGQEVSDAVVVGSVLDPTQSAIRGAAVQLTHLATGSVIQVRTDERGSYRTPPLRIGEYTISVEADGFKRFNQSGVVLDIGDVRKVDVVLEVGQVSESVNVEAVAPLLQTSDSTVGTVITNAQIEELPLNGRDYLQLGALSFPAKREGSGPTIEAEPVIEAYEGVCVEGNGNHGQVVADTK